jgi:hypothetical protein
VPRPHLLVQRHISVLIEEANLLAILIQHAAVAVM